MEQRVHADGWRALETAAEQGLFNFCGNQEGALPLVNDPWRVKQPRILQIWVHGIGG